MSEAAEPRFITAAELLAARNKIPPHVDLDLGGVLMRVHVAGSYDEMLALEEYRRELIKTIRGDDCSPELKKYRKLSDESIGAAGLILRTAMQPALTLEQALELVGDGLTTKVILAGIQKAGAQHLIETASERLAQGKADSSATQPTD